jgi:hypothetical protein
VIYLDRRTGELIGAITPVGFVALMPPQRLAELGQQGMAQLIVFSSISLPEFLQIPFIDRNQEEKHHAW